MDLKPIRKLIEPDLQVVESLIRESLASQVDLTQIIGEYIINSGGKRLRALLSILSAKALNYQGNKHHLLAAIIEIIHSATLLHDDVVDASNMRRGSPSANTVYGNMASVLCGDFLYSRAFQLMVELGQLDILAELANVSNTLAEGEMLQLKCSHHVDLTEEQYYQVIEQKTARLFEAACKIPGLLHNDYTPYVNALADYGKNIGLAFQIIDDALDYESTATTMGKNPGDDLAEGKMTLPLIYALKHAKKREQTFIKQCIETGDISQLAKIQALIAETGALTYTHTQAKNFAERAKKSLTPLPSSVYKEALLKLSDMSVARNY